MKIFYVIVSITLFFAVSSTASADTGLGAFFSFVTGLGEDVWNLATNKTPSLLTRMYAYLVEWYVMVQVFAFAAAVEISWSVAGVILEDLALGSKLNAAISFLPNDVQAALTQLKILDAIELIIQAYVTRFTMELIR